MKKIFNFNLIFNKQKKLFSTGNFDFDVLIVGAGHAGRYDFELVRSKF